MARIRTDSQSRGILFCAVEGIATAMEIPLTDALFKKRVQKLDSVYRGWILEEIHYLGACLAMFGALDDAKRLWEFAKSGKAPIVKNRLHPAAAAAMLRRWYDNCGKSYNEPSPEMHSG